MPPAWNGLQPQPALDGGIATDRVAPAGGATPSARPPRPASAPRPDRDDERAARREHALESLLELGCELGVSLDAFQTADLVMFNLMGQLATSRSAMWLLESGAAEAPVLVRCHGFARSAIEATNAACHPMLSRRFAGGHDPLRVETLIGETVAADVGFLRQAGVAVVAPMHGRGELVGWLALGPRLNGTPYDEADLHILQAALGLVGMALQNTRLYNHVREANRMLRASNASLQETDRAKSEFLSNVNHELRTPLTVVLATLECLLDSAALPDDTRTMMEVAHLRAGDLRGLLEKLLTFSDSVHGRLATRVVTAEVGSHLDAFHEARLPGVHASLHPLSYQRDHDLPPVCIDPGHLECILNELLDNALKFTPAGTPIRVRGRACGEGCERWVEVEVADEGPGVPAERMAALFSPFEQVDGSATRAVGGMGMGLALARRLAECMGGELRASSQAGRGTTFTLVLRAT